MSIKLFLKVVSVILFLTLSVTVNAQVHYSSNLKLEKAFKEFKDRYPSMDFDNNKQYTSENKFAKALFKSVVRNSAPLYLSLIMTKSEINKYLYDNSDTVSIEEFTSTVEKGYPILQEGAFRSLTRLITSKNNSGESFSWKDAKFSGFSISNRRLLKRGNFDLEIYHVKILFQVQERSYQITFSNCIKVDGKWFSGDDISFEKLLVKSDLKNPITHTVTDTIQQYSDSLATVTRSIQFLADGKCKVTYDFEIYYEPIYPIFLHERFQPQSVLIPDEESVIKGRQNHSRNEINFALMEPAEKIQFSYYIQNIDNEEIIVNSDYAVHPNRILHYYPTDFIIELPK